MVRTGFSLLIISLTYSDIGCTSFDTYSNGSGPTGAGPLEVTDGRVWSSNGFIVVGRVGNLSTAGVKSAGGIIADT